MNKTDGMHLNLEHTLKAILDLRAVLSCRMMEPMSRHTTFRIGGPADALRLRREMRESWRLYCGCAGSGTCPCGYWAMGATCWSVTAGFHGVVVAMEENWNYGGPAGGEFPSGGRGSAGLKGGPAWPWTHSLTGLEFAAGIPGQRGRRCGDECGRLRFGDEECGQPPSRVMDPGGRSPCRWTREQLELGYRTSCVARLRATWCWKR